MVACGVFTCMTLSVAFRITGNMSSPAIRVTGHSKGLTIEARLKGRSTTP